MTGRPSGPMGRRPRRSPIVAIAAVISVIGLAIGLNTQVVETLLPGTLATVARASSQAVQEASAQPLLDLANEPSAVDEVLARLPEQQQAQAAAQACPAPQAAATSSVCHVVQRGDTLFALARRFGTTVEAIQATNSLCSSKILVGQKLLIPVCAVPCPPVSVPVCPPVCPPVTVPVCPPTKVVVSVPVCPPPQIVVTVPVCPPVVCVPVCQPVVCVPVCPPVCVPFVDP